MPELQQTGDQLHLFFIHHNTTIYREELRSVLHKCVKGRVSSAYKQYTAEQQDGWNAAPLIIPQMLLQWCDNHDITICPKACSEQHRVWLWLSMWLFVHSGNVEISFFSKRESFVTLEPCKPVSKRYNDLWLLSQYNVKLIVAKCTYWSHADILSVVQPC